MMDRDQANERINEITTRLMTLTEFNVLNESEKQFAYGQLSVLYQVLHQCSEFEALKYAGQAIGLATKESAE